VDEGRKRVLLIAAAILGARKLAQYSDHCCHGRCSFRYSHANSHFLRFASEIATRNNSSGGMPLRFSYSRHA